MREMPLGIEASVKSRIEPAVIKREFPRLRWRSLTAYGFIRDLLVITPTRCLKTASLPARKAPSASRPVRPSGAGFAC